MEIDGEIAGWLILSPSAVPERWRSRGIPMVMVPLMPAEAGDLLSGGSVEPHIGPADLPLLRLVARGHSAAEIARALGISVRTSNRHVARMRAQFRVSTIQELATELARRGF